MNFQLIIFDCDGVMFDSRRANEAFYNYIRSHFGLPPLSPGEVDYVHMATAEDSVNYIMPPELQARAQALRLATGYGPFMPYMAMDPDLTGVLKRLKPGYKTAVATNRSTTIRPLLEDFGLTAYFDMVVSSLDVTNPKPHPEALLLILDRLAVPAGRALFIGDTEADAEAARGAGVALAAYKNPALPADFHMASMPDLFRILETKP